MLIMRPVVAFNCEVERLRLCGIFALRLQTTKLYRYRTGVVSKTVREKRLAENNI
jgi:hypothetical protein